MSNIAQIYKDGFGNGVPIGTIMWFMGTVENIPNGWLLCNGQNCETFVTLCSIIGANTVPDLITDGKFIRGNTIAGIVQEDTLKSHEHALSGASTGIRTGIYSNTNTGIAAWGQNATNTINLSLSGNTNATGDEETRPKNISALPIIKATDNGIIIDNSSHTATEIFNAVQHNVITGMPDYSNIIRITDTTLTEFTAPSSGTFFVLPQSGYHTAIKSANASSWLSVAYAAEGCGGDAGSYVLAIGDKLRLVWDQPTDAPWYLEDPVGATIADHVRFGIAYFVPFKTQGSVEAPANTYCVIEKGTGVMVCDSHNTWNAKESATLTGSHTQTTANFKYRIWSDGAIELFGSIPALGTTGHSFHHYTEFYKSDGTTKIVFPNTEYVILLQGIDGNETTYQQWPPLVDTKYNDCFKFSLATEMSHPCMFRIIG